MTPAKPVKRRIREPREKDRNEKRGEPVDFSVARPPVASGRRASGDLALQKAVYALSVHDPKELPGPGAPEIAFAGRSNAGKSSAINTLTGRRRLAFVSKTPGRTQLVNFFTLGTEAYLVDLPGYGYAKRPKTEREHFQKMIAGYLCGRANLACVFVLIDSRHPPQLIDLEFVQW